MKSSNEFISVSNTAFSDVVSINPYNKIPIIYNGVFEVWVLQSNGKNRFVICFDKLEHITTLLQLWYYLKKQDYDVFIYLSSEVYQNNNDVVRVILKNRLQYINCWGGIYTDNNQRINILEEMVSDLMNEDNIKYTKFTQLVLKYYFFNVDKPNAVRIIAKYLNISPSSVSRANETLYKIGVLSKTGSGAGTEYFLINKKKALKLLKPFFLLPYDNSYSLLLGDYEFNEISSNLLSGDYALSEYTDLLPLTVVKSYAIYKNKFAPFYNTYLSKSQIYSNNYLVVQSFIYDPTLFANNGIIDLLDAYIIMLKKYDLNDPRINQAFKTIERKLLDE